MRLVKDTSIAASAVRVLCVGLGHHVDPKRNSRWFTLSAGYADLDGRAFVDYYCDKCAAKLEQPKVLKIEIDLSNSAFVDDDDEIGRILRVIARRFDRREDFLPSTLIDTNGNSVGRVYLEGDE